MKLPKHFGGQGFQGMMQQMQSAMARAQQLNDELERESVPIDKGPVKMLFNGLGELQKVTIDPSIVDPNDVEGLEDLITSAMRDGFQQTTARREEKTQEIMPKIPGM
ncbi:MAG: YbaB/EbfC family nucleoid-associated protein [Fimbriimonadaceae bacterium]